MTGRYDWNPMPHVLDLACPKCGELASFEFAEIVRISLKADVPFFKESKFFDYRFFEKPQGKRWHGAIYYHGLHTKGTEGLRDLPDGYSAEDWDHSQYFRRSPTHNFGSVICPACHCRQKHELAWPRDAYFQIEYRGNVLWAFHRESAVELRNFVAATRREPKDFRWSSFLLHVPSEFLAKGARDAVVKKLDRLLKQS